jgi:outer membrane receptor protein involved in Fe transport
VDRHYGNLFPSFFLSHALKDNNSWSFAYSRRIARPSFWDLAPFVIFMDPNTFFSGNPALQPSITDNLNTSMTFKRKIVSLSYSYQANPITNFAPHIDSTTNIETLSAENQDHSISYNLSFSLPFDLTKWWTLQASLNGGYMKMFGLYNKEPVTLQQETFSGNVIQNFKLPNDYTFSVSGFYSSGGLFGLYKYQPYGSLDLGFQKKFKNQKSSLRLNFANVLNSQAFKLSVNAPEKNLVAAGVLQFNHPAARLTFTHNFGSDKVKATRERSTGTEEEKDRLKM